MKNIFFCSLTISDNVWVVQQFERTGRQPETLREIYIEISVIRQRELYIRQSTYSPGHRESHAPTMSKQQRSTIGY